MGHHLLLTPAVLLALCVASSGFLFNFRPPPPPVTPAPPRPPPVTPAPPRPPPVTPTPPRPQVLPPQILPPQILPPQILPPIVPPPQPCGAGREAVAGFARCVTVQHLLPAQHDNAALKCRARNQRLLTFDDLYEQAPLFKNHFAKTPLLRLLGARPFWVGGILPAKRADFAKRLGNVESEKAGPFKSLFLPEVRRIIASDNRESCYDLLCGDRSQVNLNRCPSLSNRCLMFRPSQNIFVFIPCASLGVFICEDVETGAINNEWSEYHSARKPNTEGEFETLPVQIRSLFAEKGKCICRRPLDVRCREVGKSELLLENNPQGLKFTLTPAAGFSCNQRLQKRGVTCPDVELSFLCPKEVDTCDSPGARDGCKQRGLECVNRCGAGHFCRRVPRRTQDPSQGECCLGKNQDRCYGTGICSAAGDPHYLTFDGVKIDYMGPCTYTLVEAVSVTADCPAFIVEAENRPKPGQRPTWLKTIVLKYRGHRVELQQKKVVTVDGSAVNLPYDSADDAFTIRNRGSGASDYLVLRTDFCLLLRWDGDRKVKVEAPTSCKTRVRGLCGNWNGNQLDDWTMKNGDLVNAKLDRAKKATELGNSWEVPNPNGVPGRCKTLELLACNKAQEVKFGAKTSCGMLVDRTGPFKPYLDQPRGLDFLTSLHEACLEDACNSDQDDVCSALQKAEDELMEAFGGEITEDWRAAAKCPSRCPDKMFYNPTMTSCQPTCQDDPDDDDVASVECSDPVTFPGCQCEDGLVLSGTDCVPRSQCGCSSPEGYIQAGQEVVTQDCKLRYRCVKLTNGNVQLKREPFGTCSSHAECKARNCVCKPGYSGNGKLCTAEKVTCPPGYSMHGSMCYRFYYTRKTWMEAQEVCGCGSGGEAQLCAAHTDAHVTFLNEAFPNSQLAIWAAGNTLAETAVLNVTLQTTPSKAFKRPQEAGCHVFLRGKSGLQPQVQDCNLKLPFCCQVDPLANKNVKPEWTPYFLPWNSPDGGSAYDTRGAIKRGDLLCPTPSQLDCLTVDGRKWQDTGVGAQCNPQRGFLCRGTRCPKFKVRGLCYPDVDECKVLGANACSGGQECVNCIGGYRCQCPGTTIPDANGKCIKQHKSCGKCVASGDPHYTRLGGLRFDWQGRCKYVLTQTCPFKMATDPPFPCFKVVAKNKPCGGASSRVTCTEFVEVDIYHKCSDMKLYYSDRIRARLDGDGTFAFGGKEKRKDVVDTDDLRISVNSGLQLLELTTPWGLKVTFRRWYVMVELPSESEGRMCGLCGDCSNPRVYTMPDGSDLTFTGGGVPEAIVRKVGLAYQEPDPSDPKCEPPPAIIEPPCSAADLVKLKDKKNCGFYKDARFDACRAVADEEYENCLVDLCAFLDKPDFEKQRCNRISDLVQSCRASLGPKAPQISWRAPDFCPVTCGDNEVFSVNAMADEVCGNLGETRLDGLEPVEGCVCQGGFRRDPVSGKCVDNEDCGCSVAFVLPPGGPSDMLTFYLPKGQMASGSAECKQVRCLGDDNLEQLDKKLDPVRGVCDVTTLPPTARCQKGYVGNGFNCTVNPDECEEGWLKVKGRCMYVGPDKVTWWQAAARCAELDAVLFTCKTQADCDAMVRDSNMTDLTFWSRGVAQLKSNVARPLITALGVSDKTPGLENYLPGELPKSLAGLKEGVLCHAFQTLSATAQAKLFDCNALNNFVCLKRDPKEPMVVTPWCHSRNPKNPDQLETTSKLNSKDCKICRLPSEVECRAADPADRSRTQHDQCGADGEVLYRCTAPDEASPCFTKEVRGKCYPGLDECALKLAQCHNSSRCVDLFYGYRCQCDPDKAMEVEGKCIPYSSCKLERELSGELSLSIPGQGRELTYRTRCRYNMAGFCGAAQPGRPNFRVEVTGVMSPNDPNNFADVEVGVHFALQGQQQYVFSASKDTAPGTIQATTGTGAGQQVTLPYRVGQGDFGVKVTAGDEGRIIFTLPGKDNLRVELCLGAGCDTLVSVQTSADYGPGCGVCSTQPDVSFNHTEDLLEANRVVISPVTCGRVEPPDPERPIEPPECDALFSTPATCGLLEQEGGPFEGCTVDASECVAQACKFGAQGLCKYLRSAITGCPGMTAEDKETAFTQSNCTPPCPDNMHFSAHVLSETPTCSEPELQKATGGLPQMKCVCNANHFLHFGKCVPRTDCGCVHDGKYVERGHSWKSADCTTLYKCKGDNSVEEFETACPGNSTCSGHGRCTCNAGFRGDCCLPMEEEGDKSCYKTCKGQSVCTCKKGFVSQCGSCVDLNECEVGQHNCDPVSERCVNKPGTFLCECASGYEKNKYTGKCTNINECLRATEELGYELCGPNSVCRDRPGHHVCVCCAGFVASGSGCVPDPSTPRPPDKECCHCMGPRCLKAGPLCYQEGDGSRVDYASYKAMYERRCLEAKPVNSAKYEQGTCGNTTPKPPASNCNPSICTPGQKATPQGNAVCRLNPPREFPSVCELLIQACRDNGNIPPSSPPAFHTGPCVPAGVQFSPWGAWTPCSPMEPSVTCSGMGTRMRQRNVIGNTVVPEERLRQHEMCNLPNCEGGTPVPVVSCGDSVYCPNTTDEVCAKVGEDGAVMTFVNPCAVYMAACSAQKNHVVILHDSPCSPDEQRPSAKPCGAPLVVTQKGFRRDTGGQICVGEDVTVGTCSSGYCPTQDTAVCCRTDEFVYVTQVVSCSGGVEGTSAYNQTVVSATSCECETVS